MNDEPHDVNEPDAPDEPLGSEEQHAPGPSPDRPEPDRPVNRAPCNHCGFDLTRAERVGECPECGAPTNSACTNCGYDLTATRPDNECPECGLPVARSVMQTLGATPANALRRALRIVFWGTIAMYVGGIIIVIVTFALAIQMASGGSSFTSVHWSAQAAGVGAYAFLAWAWWMVTAPLPATPRESDARRSRLGVRISLALLITIMLGSIAKQVLAPYVPPVGNPSANQIFTPSMLIDMGFGVAQWITEMVMLGFQASYLRFLARRIPGQPGLGLANTNAWLVPVIAVVGVIACGLGQLVASVLLIISIGMIAAGIKRYVDWLEGNAAPQTA